MRIEIEGRNCSVSRVMNRLINSLKNSGVNPICSYNGGGHAQSKGRAHIFVLDNPHKVWGLLEDDSVHIEVAEEAPGVIFKYVSPVGVRVFRSSVELQEIDTDISEFEDDEAYCERMGKVGILV